MLRQETLRQRLKLLTEEKSDLQNQLMDCQLRIEQEGKVCSTAHSYALLQYNCFSNAFDEHNMFSQSGLANLVSILYFSSNQWSNI